MLGLKDRVHALCVVHESLCILPHLLLGLHAVIFSLLFVCQPHRTGVPPNIPCFFLPLSIVQAFPATWNACTPFSSPASFISGISYTRNLLESPPPWADSDTPPLCYHSTWTFLCRGPHRVITYQKGSYEDRDRA